MSKSGHQRYLELGGIINEEDYQSALDRMINMSTLNRENPRVRQAVDIARYSGIKLNDSKSGVFDPRVVLYVILRNDIRPEGVKYHHDQMSDQRIFGEVLRMLGDAASLDKLIKAFPNISFKYERGE